MATGALNAQGVWIYGEDDSETTFSALLNKLGTSVSSNMKGRIAQIVSSATYTQVVNSTTSLVSTGLTATITPTSSSSKILVLMSLNGIGKDSGGSAYNQIELQGFRNTTQIGITYIGYTETTSYLWGLENTLTFADSPATTSPTTYSSKFKNSQPSSSSRIQGSNAVSTITLIEITQ